MKKELLFAAMLISITLTSCSNDKSETQDLDSITEIVEYTADQTTEAFFNTELNFMNGDKHFFGNTHDNICFMVNSLQELQSLYSGELSIPDIDFDKYTLVIGQQYMSQAPYHVKSVKLQQTKPVQYLLNIEVEKGDWTSQGFYDMGYWKLFSKVKTGPVEVKVNVINNK